MEPYSSDFRLNRLAISHHETATPSTSPTTTQYAERPEIAPIPVSPSKSQPDSPVARAENATAQYPSRLPPT